MTDRLLLLVSNREVQVNLAYRWSCKLIDDDWHPPSSVDYAHD